MALNAPAPRRTGCRAFAAGAVLAVAIAALPTVDAGHCYRRSGEAACLVPPVGGQGACAFCNGKCQMAYDDCTKPIECDPDSPGSCDPYFEEASDMIASGSNPRQRNYGVAITDVDGDGLFDAFVAGYSAQSGGKGANLALSFDRDSGKMVNIAPELLPTAKRQTLGVTACDVDGDGHEEIYLLNLDRYSGAGNDAAQDQLFSKSAANAAGDGSFGDMLTDSRNAKVMNQASGRSVACVDRAGEGKYSIFVSNYASGGSPKPMLVELNAEGTLEDVAPGLGMDQPNGGRAVVAGQIYDEHMSIYVNNEGGNGGNSGENYLYVGKAGGGFDQLAGPRGVADRLNTGRGTILMDANADGMLDIVWGNWNCNHKMMIQQSSGRFIDVAPTEMKQPSPIRTVIAADWDNDGYEEIFFNNIPGQNRLFSVYGSDEAEIKFDWKFRDPGAASEPDGYGTGAGVADFDGDGRLELLISHGESDPKFQGVTIYRAKEGKNNHWLRVMPLTLSGAPARGAIVHLVMKSGRMQTRTIDSGSGYLCAQEPVAHFGLGSETEYKSITIRWPGYAKPVVLDGDVLDIDTTKPHRIPHTASELPPPHALGTVEWDGTSPADLHDNFWTIFGRVGGTRNAASHLWAKFIIDRSQSLSHTIFMKMFSGFCPVSGSPISEGRASFGMKIADVLGGQHDGYIYFCCSPCVCDTNEFIKIDTKTVTTADGPKEYKFLVIGDPCVDPAVLHDVGGAGRGSLTIPNVKCSNGNEKSSAAGVLKDAVRSDHGYIIIGMFFDEPVNGLTGSYTEAVGTFDDSCAQRAKEGYRSGMGQIFRMVAAISSIQTGPSGTHPSAFVLDGTTPAPAVITARRITTTTNNARCAGIISAEAVAEIDALIELHPIVLFGIEDVRCTMAAEQALNAYRVCFHTHYFGMEDAMWDYFKCLYPQEKVGSTLMHSYLFIDHQFVGNGFRLLQNPSDSRCTNAGGKPCLTQCDLQEKLGFADVQLKPYSGKCPAPTLPPTRAAEAVSEPSTSTSSTSTTVTTTTVTTTTKLRDCAYSMSECTEACERGPERTITVTRQPTGYGKRCPTRTDLPNCEPGDGRCPTTSTTSTRTTSEPTKNPTKRPTRAPTLIPSSTPPSKVSPTTTVESRSLDGESDGSDDSSSGGYKSSSSDAVMIIVIIGVVLVIAIIGFAALMMTKSKPVGVDRNVLTNPTYDVSPAQSATSRS